MSDVQRIATLEDAPSAVTAYLRRHNLPQRLVLAPEPLLDRCRWDSQPLLRVRRGTAIDADAVGVTLAVAGVAETGTLVLASAPERPTLLAYLPETSVVILAADWVEASYEEAWEFDPRHARGRAALGQLRHRAVADRGHRPEARARRPRAQAPPDPARRASRGLSGRRMRRQRGLTPEERALWHHAVRDTAPLRAAEAPPPVIVAGRIDAPSDPAGSAGAIPAPAADRPGARPVRSGRSGSAVVAEAATRQLSDRRPARSARHDAGRSALPSGRLPGRRAGPGQSLCAGHHRARPAPWRHAARDDPAVAGDPSPIAVSCSVSLKHACSMAARARSTCCCAVAQAGSGR